MARWSKDDSARIARRRALVEEMAVRGLGVSMITSRLAEMQMPDGRRGFLNPNTGEPYAISTVSRDLETIEEQWREEAVKSRQEHKQRQLAELRAARRAAWKEHQYGEVRLNLQAEMRLLGTDEPLGLKHEGEIAIDGSEYREEILSALSRIADADEKA